jgi:capsular polysaccharide transport system permease protein
MSMKVRVLNRLHDFAFGKGRLFPLLCVLPTTLATLYFAFFAHDVYVSESHFIVRNQERQSSSGITGFLQSSGLSTADADTYSVQDFLTSRDALHQLDERLAMRQAMGRTEVDWLKRFPGPFYDGSFESLLLYYRRNVVETDLDTTSQIVSLMTRAFTADDAYRINETLLQLSEDLVNKMNDRARTDLVHFATSDVQAAEQAATAATNAVSAYRNGDTIYNPDKQSELQLQRVEQVNADLMATRRQLADVEAVAPVSPQIPVLAARVKMLEASVNAESSKVAGGKRSLSTKSAEFAAISLQQDFAARRLQLALSTLQSAREDALHKQLYVERINEPNRPDIAIEPKRVRNVLATLILSLIVFGVVSLLTASVKEHAE